MPASRGNQVRTAKPSQAPNLSFAGLIGVLIPLQQDCRRNSEAPLPEKVVHCLAQMYQVYRSNTQYSDFDVTTDMLSDARRGVPGDNMRKRRIDDELT